MLLRTSLPNLFARQTFCHTNRFYFSIFLLNCLDYNTDFMKKVLQTKVVQNKIFYRKLNGCLCLSVPRVELGAPKIVIFEKILYCIEIEKHVHLGPDAVNNTNYIKKCFKQKLCRVKFLAKNSVDTCVYLLQEWS